MGRQKLVDDTARRRKEDLDTAAAMAKNDTMLANPQPREAFEAALKRFDVTQPVGEDDDGGLDAPTRLRRQRRLVLAHLIRNDDFNRQGRKPDETSACRPEAAGTGG